MRQHMLKPKSDVRIDGRGSQVALAGCSISQRRCIRLAWSSVDIERPDTSANDRINTGNQTTVHDGPAGRSSEHCLCAADGEDFITMSRRRAGENPAVVGRHENLRYRRLRAVPRQYVMIPPSDPRTLVLAFALLRKLQRTI